jgi:hypothetical protein
MLLILKEHNLDIDADQVKKYDFVISAAKSEIKFEGIRSWLGRHLVNKRSTSSDVSELK